MSPKQAQTATHTPGELLLLATLLAEADERLLADLIAARHKAGLTQRQVAELLGIKQASVAAFEHYDNDPRLSTIRRYALAVGAAIQHSVECCDEEAVTPTKASLPWERLDAPTPVTISFMDATGAQLVGAPSSLSTDFAFAA